MLPPEKRKPPTVVVPLLVGPGQHDPPHAAATVTTTAKAPISHKNGRLLVIEPSRGQAGPPDQTSGKGPFFHLGHLERCRTGHHPCTLDPDATRHDHSLHRGKREFGGPGDGRDQKRAGGGLGTVLRRKSGHYVAAESATGDERGERRGRDDLNCGCPDTGHDERYREW